MTAAAMRRFSTSLLRGKKLKSDISKDVSQKVASVSSEGQEECVSSDGRRECNHFVSHSPHFSTDAPKVGDGIFRLAVKDNIATAHLATQCASKMLAGHVSPFEATIVRQLQERGAQVVGKTNMDEFGMGSHSTHSAHGAVINSLRPPPSSSSSSSSSETENFEPLSAGGSSGGSAVAVQLGEADVALGTDTGGSVRLPAAYTGVVGYKPSYGMLSRHGVVPHANSLDTVGLLARRPALLRHLVFTTRLHAEHDPADPTSLPPATRQRLCAAAASSPMWPSPGELSVGVPAEYSIAELAPAVRDAWAAAVDKLAAAGVRVSTVSLPSTRAALCAYYVLAPAEASSNLAKYDGLRYGLRADGDGDGSALYAETRGAGFGDEVKRRILLGAYTLSAAAKDSYFVQAQRVRRLVRRDFDAVLRRRNSLLPPPLSKPLAGDGPRGRTVRENSNVDEDGAAAKVDFLLCPTAPTFAPRLKDVAAGGGASSVDAYTNDVFTVPASLAGLPAVSVPVWPEGSDLPAGMQLIGQFWDDERLLRMADNLLELFET